MKLAHVHPAHDAVIISHCTALLLMLLMVLMLMRGRRSPFAQSNRGRHEKIHFMDDEF
jgi:hypothetical protein